MEKLYKPCKYPGCVCISREGWCPQHKPEALSYRDTRSKESYQNRRLYFSSWWKKVREDHLLIEPYCRTCKAHDVKTRAVEVDHIISHKGDRNIFYNKNNLQSLCKQCHGRKTAMENHNFKSKKVLPPT